MAVTWDQFTVAKKAAAEAYAESVLKDRDQIDAIFAGPEAMKMPGRRYAVNDVQCVAGQNEHHIDAAIAAFLTTIGIGIDGR